MILVLGKIPKLDNALYLTNRLKHNIDPCIRLEKKHIHLLFKSLYLDGLISIGDIHDIQKIIADGEDIITLKDLEVIADRNWEIFQHLRGYFKDYDEPDEENIILPFIPGLENTSLLQLLTFKRDNYVIDLRFSNVNRSFLYSVLGYLHGEAYIVSNNLDFNVNEIIIGDVNLFSLRNISSEPYKLLKKHIILEDGRYKIKGNAPAFFKDQGIFIPKYESQEPIDVLSLVFRSRERDYSSDVENILYSVWTDGSKNERELIDMLTDVFGTDYVVRVVLYLLLRYGLLSYISTPTGRQYVISLKGMRLIIERMKKHEEKEKE